MKLRLLALLFVFSILGASPAAARTVVYVSESGDNRIAVYSLDERSGALTRLGETSLEGAPGSLAISPDRSRLHAAVRTRKAFATLAIAPDTGLLTLLSSAPAAGSAAYVFADATSQWLLAAYYGEGLVSVSRLSDGQVRDAPEQVLETGPKAHAIQLDPANRFALVPHVMVLNKVEQLRFDAGTGRLSPNEPPRVAGAEGAGPRHLAFHPNGRWVYLVNEQGKSVTHCDYDPATGALSLRDTLPTVPPGWDLTQGSCAHIEVSADGRFVYASNRGHDSLAVFAVDSRIGALRSLGQTPTGKTPRSFNLVPEGETFLVSAGQGADNLTVFRRDSETGVLSPLHVIACGKSPAWVQCLRLD